MKHNRGMITVWGTDTVWGIIICGAQKDVLLLYDAPKGDIITI